jgi:hypothetical protein
MGQAIASSRIQPGRLTVFAPCCQWIGGWNSRAPLGGNTTRQCPHPGRSRDRAHRELALRIASLPVFTGPGRRVQAASGIAAWTPTGAAIVFKPAKPVRDTIEPSFSRGGPQASSLLCKGVGATRRRSNASDIPEHAVSGHHWLRCALGYLSDMSCGTRRQ